MDLDEWVWRNRVTLRDISEGTGIHVNTLSSVKLKKIVPRLDVAVKIHMFTNGEVPYEEMMPPEALEKIKKAVHK